MNFHKVSIIIPAYNEARTIRAVVERTVRADTLGLTKEIIVVDNNSTDGTKKLIRDLATQYPIITPIFHTENEGVGKSWRDGMHIATGQIFVRQDADTEYQPEDIHDLIRPIIEGTALVVFGSRRMDKDRSTYQYRSYLLGGVIINTFFNIVAGVKLTDALTASKVFHRCIFDKIALHETHFEMEGELIAKLVRAGYKILEVPITYKARSFEEGKKIRWWHAFRLMWAVVKHRFTRLK